MTKITLSGYIIVTDTDLPMVSKALKKHIELTRAEAGCLVFEITQHTSRSNRFQVYEEFRDKEAFLEHQERVKVSDWGRITCNVERHYEVTGLGSQT